jgi:hypothetical protein
MDADRLYRRYGELQSYVGWTKDDANRIAAIGPLLGPYLPSLIDDFYEEIERHPDARKVITGGQAQIDRLKGTLIHWVHELLAGTYDVAYVVRRWRVGWRHVEIGLEQVYTNVALSRLRTGLVRTLHECWRGDPSTLKETVRSLNKLLDLDLAIIEDAYQAEYMARLQRNERLATLGAQRHARETRRSPPSDRAERGGGRQRHHVAVELRQGPGAGLEAGRPGAAGARSARDQPARRSARGHGGMPTDLAPRARRRRAAPDRAGKPGP